MKAFVLSALGASMLVSCAEAALYLSGTSYSQNFDSLGAGLPSAVYFRVVALSGSSGSGSRDTFGIDDFTLSYSVVPEPVTVALVAFGVVLAGCQLSRHLCARTCQ